ncbi:MULTISPECIES: transposase [unclassified Streptomyces]|uniref:IS701 family transposase n=1 Tax=unclassified Streptomyces TaxID=2593676 RepID=UPI001660968A|nr:MULTISPECIES: transposase [unclassified Streptomyces]MBD0711176.1 transposase [Streptomyces sp. CBMA291]MBD0714207.1 transposase [Streptomyces sp. CBMA370]
MLSLDSRTPAGLRGTRPSSSRSGPHDGDLTEITSILFTSLSRTDQGTKAMHYLRGLLETPGRKSIRNIAALLGEQVSEQNLHHFISGSTWDWIPVRRALADHWIDAQPPRAWVVQPVIIPKTGRHTVGVDRHFVPTLGQVMNAQRAIGVWAASDNASTPINWRLHLPRAWLKDSLRRTQAAIPDSAPVETFSESVIAAVRESVTRWRLPIRPFVLDSCEVHAVPVFERLHAAGMPLLVSVCEDQPLTVADPALPAAGKEPLTAEQIMIMAGALRRPVPAGPHEPGKPPRAHWAATVRVSGPSLPGPSAGQGDALLLGVGEEGGRWPAKLWLTNLSSAPPASLVLLSSLAQQVDRDFTDIADRVGIRDFSGRSFDGWHRHVTLASAAHAVVASAGNGR